MPVNPQDFTLSPAGSANFLPTLDDQLGFAAGAVVVDNTTNQWLYLPDLDRYVPPFTLSATYPANGQQRARAVFSPTSVPFGIVQVPTIAGQIARVVFYPETLAPSAGVGITGARTPYQDRNPLSVVGQYTSSLGPHAATYRATYTVPFGRRGVVQSTQLVTESESNAYVAGLRFIETALAYIPASGLFTAIMKDAYLYALNSIGTRDEFGEPMAFFLAPGDFVGLYTSDQGVGGSSYHFGVVNVLEFDA